MPHTIWRKMQTTFMRIELNTRIRCTKPRKKQRWRPRSIEIGADLKTCRMIIMSFLLLANSNLVTNGNSWKNQISKDKIVKVISHCRLPISTIHWRPIIIHSHQVVLLNSRMPSILFLIIRLTNKFHPRAPPSRPILWLPIMCQRLVDKFRKSQ